eukprot:1356108-Prymnesium_polylepis.1
MACLPFSGLLRLGWQQLDTHLMGLGADWPDTVPRRRSGWASSTATAYPIDTVPSPRCALQGLRPWYP